MVGKKYEKIVKHPEPKVTPNNPQTFQALSIPLPASSRNKWEKPRASSAHGFYLLGCYGSKNIAFGSVAIVQNQKYLMEPHIYLFFFLAMHPMLFDGATLSVQNKPL